MLEKERLLKEKKEKTYELHKAMRNIALLDSRAQEADQRCEEIAGELTLIHSSISTLRQEKQKLQQQNTEAMHWISSWKNRGKDGGLSASDLTECSVSLELVEFSFSDLQTATCNFSESFRIGQGGYADVFKGELSDKTVAIKQLHPHNMQWQSQFFEQVNISLGFTCMDCKLHLDRIWIPLLSFFTSEFLSAYKTIGPKCLACDFP